MFSYLACIVLYLIFLQIRRFIRFPPDDLAYSPTFPLILIVSKFFVFFRALIPYSMSSDRLAYERYPSADAVELHPKPKARPPNSKPSLIFCRIFRKTFLTTYGVFPAKHQILPTRPFCFPISLSKLKFSREDHVGCP